MRSRPKIIAGTLRLIEQGGFGAVNVAAVAEASGVSRQTVYSIFGSREELVGQALTEVAQDWVAQLDGALAGVRPAPEFVVELVVAGRALCRAHPVLAGLIVAERGNPLFDEGMIQQAIPVVTGLLAGAVERDARIAAVIDEVAEMLTRIALSVVLFDSDRIVTDDGLRAFLQRWLLLPLADVVEAGSARG